MKQFLLTFILTLTSCGLFSQGTDTWTAFWNKDSTLIGYKDKIGIVKIEPKFMSIDAAKRFDNIIAVMEDFNGSYKSYYLTKSDRIIGIDSLYIFDNGADCESEGFIRFRNKTTDKVGMFNRNGDMVIPAEYNDLTSVRNGMIIALKRAKKKIWEGGEHYSWKGGEELLIDTNNIVLIDNFKYDNNIDFYSLQVTENPVPDTIRRNFKTNNGQYFSFIDFEKEFNAWLKSSLLENFTKNILKNATYKEVTFWKELNGWTREAKENFIERNFELIKSKLLQLNSKDCDFNIFNEGLNPYIYESDEYMDFFNNCEESKDWIYPVKSIVINYRNNKDLEQESFDFLRTDDGYKLISVTIRNGELK
jgi:hypothetical protein